VFTSPTIAFVVVVGMGVVVLLRHAKVVAARPAAASAGG